MSCLGHSRAFLSRTKQAAKNAFNQEEAMRNCLLCRDRLAFIEEHHKDASGFKETALKINKCQTCRDNLKAIIACAKMGHVYAQPD